MVGPLILPRCILHIVSGTNAGLNQFRRVYAAGHIGTEAPRDISGPNEGLWGLCVSVIPSLGADSRGGGKSTTPDGKTSDVFAAIPDGSLRHLENTPVSKAMSHIPCFPDLARDLPQTEGLT